MGSGTTSAPDKLEMRFQSGALVRRIHPRLTHLREVRTSDSESGPMRSSGSLVSALRNAPKHWPYTISFGSVAYSQLPQQLTLYPRKLHLATNSSSPPPTSMVGPRVTRSLSGGSGRVVLRLGLQLTRQRQRRLRCFPRDSQLQCQHLRRGLVRLQHQLLMPAR